MITLLLQKYAEDSLRVKVLQSSNRADRSDHRKPRLLRRGLGELYEIEKILTGLRSTADRQNPRLLGRGASLLARIFIMSKAYLQVIPKTCTNNPGGL